MERSPAPPGETTPAPSPTETATEESPEEVAARNHIPVPAGGSVESAEETETSVHVTLAYQGQPKIDAYRKQLRKAGWRLVDSRPIGSLGFLLERRFAGIRFVCAVLQYLANGIVIWDLHLAFQQCRKAYGGL